VDLEHRVRMFVLNFFFTRRALCVKCRDDSNDLLLLFLPYIPLFAIGQAGPLWSSIAGIISAIF